LRYEYADAINSLLFSKGELERDLMKYESHLKITARTLRENMTEAELKLWSALRKKQVNNLQFYRQRPLGKYIVDFYCPAKNVIIEVDGGQHYDENAIGRDKDRSDYLKKFFRLKIIRFTNLEVLNNLEGVIYKILEEAE
jgi:very-short-patch-repair endonuclease